MHSFHPSRGRILFEVFCALGIVVSCVGAWKQTGASALLVAAAAAGLYGFVHLFDLLRRDPASAEEPQRIEFEPEAKEPPVLTAAPVVKLEAVVEAEPVEQEAPRATKGGKAKAPRKNGGRRTSASRQATATAPVLSEVEEVAEHLPLDEVEALVHHEEAAHAPIEPLFMTEPLGRPHRAVFGRKAG